MKRRLLLVAGTASVLPAWADDTAAAALREGGAVLALRHALAPGTFDPPEFKLGDCSTQRNLDEQGRAQARRLGEWFRSRGLSPARVRSSPWCRCLETAQLAFGRSETWPLLGSPRGPDEASRGGPLVAQAAALRRALAQVPSLGFEVWVSHMFIINELAPGGVASGEGLVLRSSADTGVRLLGRIAAA